MNKYEIQELKQSFDLREIAGEFTALKGTNEKFGVCPKCGGTDRFHVQTFMFFCRQCLPPEKGRHDVIDFLIWVGKCSDFKAAIQNLVDRRNGNIEKLDFPLSGTTGYKPIQEANHDWIGYANNVAIRANERLHKSQKAKLYLSDRGIEPNTIDALLLGLSGKMDSTRTTRETITIPYIDPSRGVVSIQNRYIEPVAERYSRFGFNGFYGENDFYILPFRDSDTLVIVEGEFNAISIWQSTDFNVVSVGTQNYTKKALESIQKLSKQSSHTIAWFDDELISKRFLASFSGKKSYIKPPRNQTKIFDANDILTIRRGKTLEKYILQNQEIAN